MTGKLSAMLRRPARLAIGVVSAMLLTTAAVVPGSEDGPRSAEPAGAVSDHVLIVSIDGLRPDAIGEYDAETLERLMREGTYSLDAQTIVPSKTLPSHTSMLTGTAPDVHGVTWNSRASDDHGVVQVPTIFELAREQGFGTAAFFSKAKFHHLVRPGSLDYWQGPESNIGHWLATRTVPDAIRYMRHERPNLMFVHIGEPDYAGHTMKWMSYVYGLAVGRADAAVARLLDAADEAYGAGNYTVLLTSDHGGHGRNHGSADPRDTTIPWIAWGKGVDAGGVLGEGVRIMDTAATALWLLGVRSPDDWAGLPVAAAFTDDARRAAVSALGTVPTRRTAAAVATGSAAR